MAELDEPSNAADCELWYDYYKNQPTLSDIPRSPEELESIYASRLKNSFFGNSWESVYFQINQRFLLMFPDNSQVSKLKAAYWIHQATVEIVQPTSDDSPPFQLQIQLKIPKKPKGKRLPVLIGFANQLLLKSWCNRLTDISRASLPRLFAVGHPQEVQHVVHINATSKVDPDDPAGIDLLAPEMQRWLKGQGFIQSISPQNEAMVKRMVLLAQQEGGPRVPPNEALRMAGKGHVKPLEEMSTKGKPNKEFDLGRKLDSGSQGAVYLGKDKKTGGTVAIKHVELNNKNPRSAEKELSLLTHEVGFLFAIDHPNIVRLYCSFKNGPDVWLIMECMDGGKLTDLVEDTAIVFNEAQIAAVMYEVLKGLSYLHNSECMHRDIKSDNVLISGKGEVKLGDFGFAAGMANSRACKHKTVVGTPYWMAPEVIQGSVGYDAKADIWSMGILLIELCEKEPPWMDLSTMNAMYKIVNSPPPTLRTTGKGSWSRDLQEFLSLMLVKTASERASADDLLKHPFLRKRCDTRFLGDMLRKQRF